MLFIDNPDSIFLCSLKATHRVEYCVWIHTNDIIEFRSDFVIGMKI